MKVYLNKGAFLNAQHQLLMLLIWQNVISLANEIATGGYVLTPNYFNNFAPTNDVLSTENIFTAQNIAGSSGSDLDGMWKCTLHYNQNPNGTTVFLPYPTSTINSKLAIPEEVVHTPDKPMYQESGWVF